MRLTLPVLGEEEEGMLWQAVVKALSPQTYKY